MPHCIFEHSANIADDPDWPRIMRTIHDKLVATGQFLAGDIKSRAIQHDNYLIGNGEQNQSFVTLNLQILDGRSDDLKRELAQMALEILIEGFPKSLAEQKCSITVQVSEIHRPSYQRQVSY